MNGNPSARISRRDLLRQGSLALVAGGVLAACGGAAAPTPSTSNSAATSNQAASVSAASSVGAASASASRATLKLSLGLASKPAPALPNSVLWLAKDLGFYDREGLDVALNELDGTPTVIAAMLSGDIDVGNVSTDQVLKLTAQKSVDMRAIHSPDARQYFMVASKDSLASPSDLKAKNFGVSKLGAVDDTMTRLVLANLNVKPTDLSYVNIGAPDARAQALLAGRIDATTMSLSTWSSIQHEKGVKTLIGADDYYKAAPIVLKVDASTSKVVKEKSEQLRRFTAAIIKASRAFAQDQKTWVDAMTKRRPDLKPQDVQDLWPAFKEAWATNGLLNLNDYQKTSDFLYGTDDFKGVPKLDLAGWTDTEFVDSVLKEIGVDPKIDPPGRTI
ncbi:MAG: ABC transporter substrate-binding protein [Chloroflexi bacterium]|nr:ABC transporter substrate-binding protein [Chloroflexota bacterium]